MIINVDRTWCFTGHRPHKLPEDIYPLFLAIRDSIAYAHLKYGINNFITGMAPGWDLLAADAVIDTKVKYPKLNLICAIPCKNHSDTFTEQDKKLYQYILDKADYVHNVTGMKYFPRCMQIRNEWMVNSSCGQIVCWNGTRGGTYNCLNYANKVNKTNRIIIHPQTLSVRFLGV